MTPSPPLTFGGTPGQDPAAVLLCCRGGFPQAVEKGWGDWIITNFREMSRLEELASPGTPSVGKEVARFASLHEWIKANTMRFLNGGGEKLVYLDSSGATVRISEGDKAKFPVMAHEATYSGGRVVLMPDDSLPIYGMGGVRAIHHYLAPYGNAKRYFFGFSKHGSAFVETWSKHIRFDACVIWSAVNPPTERDETPRIPTRVIVVYGVKEKCSRFGLRSCRETSVEVAKAFEESGSQVRIWSHDLAGPWILPGHTWAPEYNSRIVDHLEIP